MKTSNDWTRREFLILSALAAAAGCAPVHGAPLASTPAPSPTAGGSARGITPETIARAEKLFAVEYTPAERQQIVATIDELIESVEARRHHFLGFDRAPATRFDPVLPGRMRPEGDDRFRPLDSRRKLPDSDTEIAFASLADLGYWLRTRKISSRALTELSLERLDAHDDTLHCVVTLTRERALAKARECDGEIEKGRYRGPLHGIPWGAKDLFDTRGIRTTWGAAPYRDRVPERDAFAVRQMDDAGAVLVAKLTLGALAYGDIWFDGKTRNPWNPEEGSSGSSAGSAAAVTAGLVPFALGTETLGSIVAPSMRCGCTGLRPTFGRVARTGAMALCWSLDKIGPLCRSAHDTALVLSELHGAENSDPSSAPARFEMQASEPVTGLRIGYIPAHFEGDGVRPPDRIALEAARTAGLKLVEIELPERPYGSLLAGLYAESAAAFEHLTLANKDDQLVWQDDEAWPNTFRQTRFLSAIDLVQADRFRREVMEIMDGIFQDVDAILSPSFAGQLLTITNYTGHPSLTLRAGFVELPTRKGFAASPKDTGPAHRVPHGVTLWGRLFDEGTLCRIGMALENELDVADERPPGFG